MADWFMNLIYWIINMYINNFLAPFMLLLGFFNMAQTGSDIYFGFNNLFAIPGVSSDYTALPGPSMNVAM